MEVEVYFFFFFFSSHNSRLSLHSSQVADAAVAYHGFCSMNRLGLFPLPSGRDASPLAGFPPRIKFASTHLYTWVKRGTVRV